MLLIGLKTEKNVVGLHDTDFSVVSHQRTDVIAGSPSDTKETLTKLYQSMVKKAETAQKKINEIEDELEFSNMSDEEYISKRNKLYKLLPDTKVLEYDQVLVVEGIVLK